MIRNFFTLEDPRAWDTRGAKFRRSARVYDIPVRDTSGYTRGVRVTRLALVSTIRQVTINNWS